MRFYRFILISLLLCFVFPLMSNADQIEEAKEAIKNEDFIKAKRVLNTLAEENNAEAQNLLGALYVNGWGTEKDLTKGLSLIMKAAKQGHEAAKMNAFKLCMDLGNRGDMAAMFNVGYMCLNGWGGEQEKDVCLGWMETAGNLGHEKSITTLTKIYTKGMFDVTPDEEKAAYWNKMSSAYDSGMDGKWEVSAPVGQDGPPMNISYEFKTDGNELTGIIVGFDGEVNQIKNGVIDGNNFSFTVDSKFFGRNATEKYTGIFLGDRLELTQVTETDRQRGSGKRTSTTAGVIGPPQKFTANRVE